MKKIITIIILSALLNAQIPQKRIVAEWEPAIGTIIRWPLGIPSDLVVELASNDILYVLVESSWQENSARDSFTNWDIDLSNIEFIYTQTYSHWTRDHGPQFIIGKDYWRVVNQIFDGYPEEPGCLDECDEDMLLSDCSGFEFCNNQPGYLDEGYDCYVANSLCEDYNNDGQIMDWIGDGYCDDGAWGFDFMCDQYSWDCGDCGELISDEQGYCDKEISIDVQRSSYGRPLNGGSRGWSEDDDTNLDFASQLDWDILDLPLFFTGGNFMTDGYGMGFSTELMINENNMDQESFFDIVSEYLFLEDFHILSNPNESSIQHIDCLAKLVNSETVIIKEVPESSPEYDCIEDFAESFYEYNTFYDRPFNIHRIFCPQINGGSWETNPVAAYTNSLILNGKVLVPMYGIQEDEDAIHSFEDAMPGYDIIGFDASGDNYSEPWYGEDALHCRTIGVFDPNMIHISHRSIRSSELHDSNPIIIIAEVFDYGKNKDIEVFLEWKYTTNDGPYLAIPLECNDKFICTGVLDNINSNSDISYFISAISSEGLSASNPNYGWHTFKTPESIQGDLNGDGVTNILDIIAQVNAILDQDYFSGYDLNGDLAINVQDIIILINLILEN